MDGLKKYTPRVSKKILLLIAGLVWGFAGFRVFTLGAGDVISHNGNLIVTALFGALVFFIFFKFIFSKMFKKHTTRIVNSELEKHCAFSFFDFKSYLIMGFMIFFGITVRNLGIFNPVYLGTFYIGLGAALFMAGVYFFIGFLKFEDIKIKFKKVA
ncbi:hypothetical protein [Clostridium sp. B9]|uniref:hypothetical protein n=1 Tax=Clostridium sp. B9 TaxID=3423224 RepID=UPI003D2EB3B7